MATVPQNRNGELNGQLPRSGESNQNGKLIQIVSSEEMIRERVERERERLERKAGIEPRRRNQFHRPIERPFTKDQRGHTTILFGGLTWKHEKLIHGVLENLGYKCEAVPTPDKRAFQLGKEYGNNGQCNPTYFTVGNLVQFLQGLEAEGKSKQEIIDSYVFFTAGACGPCRFGMYEAEYRLALRNSGFDGFRVLLFQQSGGLNQAEAEAGLEMNLDFFLGILNALNIGDVINDVAYQIRPYEVNAGETDRVLAECMEILHETIRNKPALETQLSKLTGDETAKFLRQLLGEDYIRPLHEIRERLNAIDVDRTRVKPIVKITGEFWAQTTEGDGNFNMFRFLEKEGGQVLVEPIATWIAYMIHQVVQKYRDNKGLEDGAVLPPMWQVAKRMKIEVATQKKIARLKLAEKIFTREYHRVCEALGGLTHHLLNQYELQRIAHPYYNSRAAGGEGHLEVAKNIYYTNKSLAHMVLCLKPFGCMPSTQSDGAQSAVMSHYRDMIFLPIETSGEGDVNAHSRVQMALGEAKAKAKREFKTALDEAGCTFEDVRQFVEEHPELKRPMYKVPQREGVVGVAANFVQHVGERIKKEGHARVAVSFAA
jgi:predicted nucleotide-binding protein (sugar kinase/HSP70/actin superfamily)